MPKNIAEEAELNLTEEGQGFVPEPEASDAAVADSRFTADDLAKAREQEKQKLYPTMQKLQEELAALKQEREERQLTEAEREAKRKERAAQRDAERQAKREQELSAKELLKEKEREWQDQLATERAERERAFALLEREREFQNLQQYRAQRLEAERENIVPELIDLIQGNTQEEIEQSIADLKDRSAKIFESVAQVAQQTRKDMRGVSTTLPASGPLDNDSEQRFSSPADIQNMSMADYAKNRAKLLGNSGSTSGQGLFG